MPLAWPRGVVGLHHPAFDAATRVPKPVEMLLLYRHSSVRRGCWILPVDLLTTAGLLILSASSAHCPKWCPWLSRDSLHAVGIPLPFHRQLLDVPGLDYPSVGHGNDVLRRVEASSQINPIEPSSCHYSSLRLAGNCMQDQTPKLIHFSLVCLMLESLIWCHAVASYIELGDKIGTVLYQPVEHRVRCLNLCSKFGLEAELDCPYHAFDRLYSSFNCSIALRFAYRTILLEFSSIGCRRGAVGRPCLDQLSDQALEGFFLIASYNQVSPQPPFLDVSD